MIPQVKTWRVTFTLLDGTILSKTVDAVNKRFAKSLANEALGYPSWNSIKITVGLIRS